MKCWNESELGVPYVDVFSPEMHFYFSTRADKNP